ncbi:uncharacterized protein LOC108711358 isoform X1 [Xenopus laevis]|uniref:Uncharacterized protein LOC108711358 isoform X1 n=1 Tax=Xenopus laevis TaxID=8355 RepID=A0A8J0UVE8_XENLA|nr:uncharacterized protein LOC108711358 isoform X1 [Xenopus laevis]
MKVIMDFVKILFNVVAMTLCYLLLVEGAGCHYFHKYEKENLTIKCDLCIDQNMSVCWYNYNKENISCEGCSLTVPKHGGIFECRKEDMKDTSFSLQSNNNTTCNSRSTFIISSVSDQETNNNQKSQIINISDNVNLSCQFDRSNLQFISFWVAVYPNRGNHCLFSVDNYFTDFNKNVYHHSVVGEGQNRINFFTLTNHYDAIQKQHLEIKKAKSSDSGTYLCLYFIWNNGKLEWKLGSNISLEVQDPTDNAGRCSTVPNSHNTTYTTSHRNQMRSTEETTYNARSGQNIFIRVGMTGGIIIMSALILLFLYIKKSRKNKMKQQRIRNPDTVDYECTPYAICERKDMEENPDCLFSGD